MILKACPFCQGEAEIMRFGNSSRSTIYQCLQCGCRLETGETSNHGEIWNTRHNPDRELLVQLSLFSHLFDELAWMREQGSYKAGFDMGQKILADKIRKHLEENP